MHLPFCEERCSFCGCNVVITPHRDVAEPLPRRARARDRSAGARTCRGAGPSRSCTGAAARRPTTRPSSSSASSRGSRATSRFAPDAELGVEIDPRVTTVEQLDALRALGFNRLSMGVQDFDPKVQEAINRVQSYEQTRDLLSMHARALGFGSINVDLIYGLPHQTDQSFAQTLDQVARRCGPTASRSYSFAYVPWMSAHMKRMLEGGAAAAEPSWRCSAARVEAFGGAGYARSAWTTSRCPTTSWRARVEARTLHRNFMGYTVQTASDMVALGVSAIGDVQGAFVQNTKKLPEYYDARRRRPLPDRARLRARRRRRDPPPRDHRADVQRPRSTCATSRRASASASREYFARRARRADRARVAGGRRTGPGRARAHRGRRRSAGCSCATSAWCSTGTCAPRTGGPKPVFSRTV